MPEDDPILVDRIQKWERELERLRWRLARLTSFLAQHVASPAVWANYQDALEQEEASHFPRLPPE
jgi:hypothetical protein